MSIRITNDKNKRIIVIKNKDDINNLDPSIASIDTDPAHWDLFGGFGLDRNNPVDHVSDDDHPEPVDDTNFNSQFNLDTFDDDDTDHYIAVSAYPAADEYASMLGDEDVINAPILPLKDPTIPDDQVHEPADDEDDQDIAAFANGFDDKFDTNDIPQGLEGEDDEQDGLAPDNGDDASNSEDPNYQGMIRTVRGAYLVYKRKETNGTYEEVWMYNVGKDLKKETSIRQAILAGTDVDPNTHMSDNGEQKARTWTIGNVQYLTISGLSQ